MKDVYTISEAAGFFGVSAQTLRHYDKIGLLRPTVQSPSNNYRLYGPGDIRRLYLIKELKAMGLPLDEIKAYCDTKNLTRLEAVLRQNNEALCARIAELSRVKARTEEYLRKMELARLDYGDACELKEFPERHAYFIGVDFAIKDLEQYAAMLSTSYAVSAPQELPGRGHILLTLPAARLREGRFRVYGGIGFLLEEPTEGPHSLHIPGGLFAVTYHLGSYDTIHRSYKRLAGDIARQGLSICGDAVEVSITDVAFTNNPADFITELQIPVAR